MSIKICKNGHKFNKSSDCPVCPICFEVERKNLPADDFRSKLAAPVQRALKNAGISKLSDLKRFTEKELTSLHGIGPNAIKKIKLSMKLANIQFKNK
jgi:hypothetical protein